MRPPCMYIKLENTFTVLNTIKIIDAFTLQSFRNPFAKPSIVCKIGFISCLRNMLTNLRSIL